MAELDGGRGVSAPCFAVERRPKEIWKQKVFCILSSQFNALKAAFISDHIVNAVPLFDNSLPPHRIQEACYQFLTGPKIRYRFPNVKAMQISLCWFPFAQIKDTYHEYVHSFNDEEKARAEIVETFPGMGLKQASMFLRNIGASKDLCVIDVHLLYYLNICHGWQVNQLTKKQYLKAEDVLRRDAAYWRQDANTLSSSRLYKARRAQSRQETWHFRLLLLSFRLGQTLRKMHSLPRI